MNHYVLKLKLFLCTDPGYCEGKKDGRYPTPGSTGCDTTYLECVFERTYIRSCAATLFYNTKSTNCEWRMDIEECGEPDISLDPKIYDRYQQTVAPQPLPSYEQITPQSYVQPFNNVHNRYVKSDDQNPCVGKIDGRHPIPGGNACAPSYLQCIHGRPFIQSCPEGLVFNKISTNCEWPNTVVGCDTYEMPQQPTIAPTLPPKVAEPVPYPEIGPIAPLPSYNNENKDPGERFCT